MAAVQHDACNQVLVNGKEFHIQKDASEYTHNLSNRFKILYGLSLWAYILSLT